MEYTQIAFLLLSAQCVAVNIHRIEVPSLVEIGTEFVVLDCQFSTHTTATLGLVMKWFFNGSASLVYQWIPPLKPQVIGLLKGRVDLNFRISDEPLQAYRAIKIMKPTTDLSGVYTCVVSTFMEEDRQTRPMLIYSKALSNKETISNQHHACSMHGAGCSMAFITLGSERSPPTIAARICHRGPTPYTPKNNFLLTDFDRDGQSQERFANYAGCIIVQKRPLNQSVSEMKMNSWGLYTIITKAVVHDDDVTEPFEEYTCTLSIPPANYTANRTTIYYPGLMPTTFIAVYEIQKPQERHANGNSVLRRHYLAQLLSFLLSVFRLTRHLV